MPIPRRYAEPNPSYSPAGAYPDDLFAVPVDHNGNSYMQVRGPRPHRFGSRWSRFVAPKQTAEVEQAIADNVIGLRKSRIMAALGKGSAVQFENGRPAAQASVRKLIADYKNTVRNRTIGGFVAAAGIAGAAAVVDRVQKKKLHHGLTQVDEPPAGTEEKLGPTANSDYHPAVDGLKHAEIDDDELGRAETRSRRLANVAGVGSLLGAGGLGYLAYRGHQKRKLTGKGLGGFGHMLGAGGVLVGGLSIADHQARKALVARASNRRTDPHERRVALAKLVATSSPRQVAGAMHSVAGGLHQKETEMTKSSADLVTAHVMGRVSKSSKTHGRTLSIEKIRTALRLARATQPRTVTRHGNRFAKNETVMKHVGAGSGSPWASLVKKVQMRLPPGLEIK